jgi:hypothetical protein
MSCVRLCTLASLAFARVALGFAPPYSMALRGVGSAPLASRRPFSFAAPWSRRVQTRPVMSAAHPIRTEKPQVEFLAPVSGQKYLQWFPFFVESSETGQSSNNFFDQPGDVLTWSGDLVIIPLFEPEGDNKEQLASLNAQATELDSKLDGALSEMISLNELKGKPGSSSLVRLGKSAPVSSLCFQI